MDPIPRLKRVTSSKSHWYALRSLSDGPLQTIRLHLPDLSLEIPPFVGRGCAGLDGLRLGRFGGLPGMVGVESIELSSFHEICYKLFFALIFNYFRYRLIEVQTSSGEKSTGPICFKMRLVV